MEIIIKPVLTEKMTMLTDKQNKVAFVVAKDANKTDRMANTTQIAMSIQIKSTSGRLSVATC